MMKRSSGGRVRKVAKVFSVTTVAGISRIKDELDSEVADSQSRSRDAGDSTAAVTTTEPSL